jgi:hypothetical protein
MISARPLRAVGLALVCCVGTACQPVEDVGVSSSNAWIQGVVVSAASGLPVAGATVAFAASLGNPDCAGALLTAYTVPSGVVTDSAGRYAARVSLYGIGPRTYCVRVSTLAASVDQRNVKFRDEGDRAIDTVNVRIEVP